MPFDIISMSCMLSAAVHSQNELKQLENYSQVVSSPVPSDVLGS